MKLVIIGLGTAGFAAALTARKTDRASSITIIDSKEFDLLHPCGLPFYLEGKIKKLSDLFQVDLIATGCMLIKVGDWLKDIKPPYFHMEDNIVNEEVLTFSEDWYFCRKAKAAGAKLFAWKGLEIEHFGSKSWSNKEIIK